MDEFTASKEHEVAGCQLYIAHAAWRLWHPDLQLATCAVLWLLYHDGTRKWKRVDVSSVMSTFRNESVKHVSLYRILKRHNIRACDATEQRQHSGVEI
jgi:hypothetical protein